MRAAARGFGDPWSRSYYREGAWQTLQRKVFSGRG